MKAGQDQQLQDAAAHTANLDPTHHSSKELVA